MNVDNISLITNFIVGFLLGVWYADTYIDTSKAIWPQIKKQIPGLMILIGVLLLSSAAIDTVLRCVATYGL